MVIPGSKAKKKTDGGIADATIALLKGVLPPTLAGVVFSRRTGDIDSL